MSRITAPQSCPSCGSLLERVNDQLFCRNDTDCPAQNTGKLINFCKKLKIKGFGEATLDKLEISDISELEQLEPQDYIDAGFSQHMSNKLHNTVWERLNAGIDFREFIAALSIPLVGDSASSKLSFSNLEDITYDKLREQGLGDKVSQNLSNWVANDWPLMKHTWEQYLVFSKAEPKSASLGLTVVITGKLNDFKNRAEATKYLESLGFTVKSSVTKTTDFLICEDGTTGSSYQKAIQHNIQITTIKSLEDNLCQK